jgi:anthrone oxygenase-like protein
METTMVAGLIALTIAAAFAGAAFYVGFAEQPARLQLDEKALLTQWKPSYTRGFIMQASLAVISAAFGFLAGFLLRDWRWAVVAAVILVNWPYTLLVMLPTNKKIAAWPLESASAESRALIVKWGTMHAVRTVLGLVATAGYLLLAAA